MESTAEEIEGQTPRKKRKKEKSVEEDKERVEDSDRDVKEKKRKKSRKSEEEGKVKEIRRDTGNELIFSKYSVAFLAGVFSAK